MNPHPPLAMFPPVIALMSVVLECGALRFPALMNRHIRIALVTLLTVSSLFAYYSGFWGIEFAKDVPTEVIKQHQGVARFAALLSVPTFLFSALLLQAHSKRWVQNTFFFCLTLQAALMLLTAHLGGEVVFRYGGGVLR